MSATMLDCVKCHRAIDKCKCPDIDERMHDMAYKDHVLLKWCRRCDKHYARCECAPPYTFFMICNGKDAGTRFISGAGTTVIPDLTRK